MLVEFHTTRAMQCSSWDATTVRLPGTSCTIVVARAELGAFFARADSLWLNDSRRRLEHWLARSRLTAVSSDMTYGPLQIVANPPWPSVAIRGGHVLQSRTGCRLPDPIPVEPQEHRENQDYNADQGQARQRYCWIIVSRIPACFPQCST
jgi:hypothetical protein